MEPLDINTVNATLQEEAKTRRKMRVEAYEEPQLLYDKGNKNTDRKCKSKGRKNKEKEKVNVKVR